MIYEAKQVVLKNGRVATLRSACKEDANELIAYLKQTAEETDHLMRYPDEIVCTTEQEEGFIEMMNGAERSVMICVFMDGVLAGNCSLNGTGMRKFSHSAELGIALKRDYWGMGLGTILFEELEKIAREMGLERLDLDVVSDNERAISLYQKCGFSICGVKHRAVRLEDRYADMLLMEKSLV